MENNGAKVKKHPDFLDILLLATDEEGKGLTQTEIQNEVDTFMFEGNKEHPSNPSLPAFSTIQVVKVAILYRT